MLDDDHLIYLHECDAKQEFINLFCLNEEPMEIISPILLSLFTQNKTSFVYIGWFEYSNEVRLVEWQITKFVLVFFVNKMQKPISDFMNDLQFIRRCTKLDEKLDFRKTLHQKIVPIRMDGVPNTFRSHSTFLKCMWLLVFVSSAAMSCYLIV